MATFPVCWFVVSSLVRGAGLPLPNRSEYVPFGSVRVIFFAWYDERLISKQSLGSRTASCIECVDRLEQSL